MKLTLTRLAPHAVSGWARYVIHHPDGRFLGEIREAHDIGPLGVRETAATYWLGRTEYPELHRTGYESPRTALLALVAHHNDLQKENA